MKSTIEGVAAEWCNPLTLKSEQSGGVGSSPGRTPSLERHDKGSQTRLGLLYFCDRSAWRKKPQIYLHLFQCLLKDAYVINVEKACGGWCHIEVFCHKYTEEH